MPDSKHKHRKAQGQKPPHYHEGPEDGEYAESYRYVKEIAPKVRESDRPPLKEPDKTAFISPISEIIHFIQP